MRTDEQTKRYSHHNTLDRSQGRSNYGQEYDATFSDKRWQMGNGFGATLYSDFSEADSMYVNASNVSSSVIHSASATSSWRSCTLARRAAAADVDTTQVEALQVASS